MKICFLNENLDTRAGVGRFGIEIINNVLQQEKNEVVVFTEKNSGYKLEKAILFKSYLLRNFLNIFINAIKIRKYIKDCDIVHALDGYPYGVIAALANIGLNKKLIISGIGTYSVLPLDEPIKRNLMKWAYKKADKVLCISRFTEKQILKRVNLENTTVINPGVDYDKFQKENTLTEKGNEKIILSVGALKPRKGYHVSIPAIAEVNKKYPQIKYYIVGGKPPEIYLKMVEENNLRDNVVFFENVSDEKLIDLYYQSDIFLLPSVTENENDFEGFGLVYLEAGACGKPVIGAYGSGAEDAIIDGETGILVPQNDIKKTTDVILRLLDNSNLAQKMGENGKKRTQQMSWENVSKKYLKEYNL